jgi:hypothetical protein
MVLGGLGLALSCLAKQTALLVALPLLAWSVFADRRRALFALIPFGLVLVSTTLYFQHDSDGWYWFYVIELQRHVGVFLSDQTARFWTRDLFPLGIAGALAMVYILGPARQSREGQCLTVAIVTMVLASWLSRVRSGNAINVVMPAYAALAVALGLGRGYLVELCRPLESAGRRQVERFVFALCLIQLAVPYNPLLLLPTSQDEQAGHAIVERLRSTTGEVFVPCGGYLATMAGKTAYAHQMAMFDVIKSAGPVVQTRFATELTNAFRNRRFSSVFACTSFEDWMRDQGLTEAYMKREEIFAPFDRTFLTMAGMPSRPQSVYLPRTD